MNEMEWDWFLTAKNSITGNLEQYYEGASHLDV